MSLMLRPVVGETRFETVTIDRDSVIEIRDPPPGTAGIDALTHALVVTKHRDYLVSGGVRMIAKEIWPSPEKCRECGRPKP